MSDTSLKRKEEGEILRSHERWLQQVVRSAVSIFPQTVVTNKIEDAMQEARSEFLRSYRRFTTEGWLNSSLKGFCYKRVRGAAIDYMRGRRSQHGYHSVEYDESYDSVNSIGRFEERIDLSRLLAILDDRSRSVIFMHDLAGITLADIGKHFGVTEGRICQIRLAAFDRLRELSKRE